MTTSYNTDTAKFKETFQSQAVRHRHDERSRATARVAPTMTYDTLLEPVRDSTSKSDQGLDWDDQIG
jgi:hypothetical protein